MIRPAVILRNMGRMILIIGIAMLTCLSWSMVYHEVVTMAIFQAAGLTIGIGLLLMFVYTGTENINYKEGFALVSLGWLVVSIFGAFPYLFAGYLPSFADAWFESVSGFTTTGSSVVADVEAWPRGLLFWRSLTQWLGGMGIIALLVAIIAGMGSRANQLFKAEVPGPVSDKISPRIRETARKLWKAYLLVSLACFLTLFALGMDLFDALCHTFATMATGGFSTKNNSIAFYSSPWIQWALIFFMLVAGTNFTLHYLTFKRRSLLTYIKDSEFKLYTGIILTASFLVVLSLSTHGALMGWEEKIRTAIFQVISITTTTGYATADYDRWPPLAAMMIFMVMFAGGCAGSTGGSMKPGRYLIIINHSLIELKKMLHPRAVLPLRFGSKVVSENLLFNVLQFFFLYMTFLALGTIFLTALDIDILSSLSAAAACLGNIGPGFGLVGPTRNFASMPDSGKYILGILMLVGRLEIYPILLLFLPTFWKE
ncbi:MAG: TrkH family potassium uptake protein [Syntrophomonadaceae bacterium]|nr:TrkH family potassium uptake protein [Syntrophomonadaceae bacterium]